MRFIVVSQNAASMAHILETIQPQSIVSELCHAASYADLLAQINGHNEIILVDTEFCTQPAQDILHALQSEGFNPLLIALLPENQLASAEELLNQGVVDIIQRSDLSHLELAAVRARFQAMVRQTISTDRAHTAERISESTAELRQLNQQLAKAMYAKDEFLANMSHEFRTPLTAILGKSELLQDGIHGPLTARQRNSIQIIEESGQHLLSLINDILDLAKIEAGKVSLNLTTVDVVSVSESAIRFVQQMALDRQITIEFSHDPHVEKIQADMRRLKQILVNLLSNAIKFTASGGQISLSIVGLPKTATVEFRVWDTGIGIESADIEKLFTPFMQLNSGIGRTHEGTGLGLSLVYKLTEMHHGRVHVTSQPQTGSCFTLVLPWQPKLASAETLPHAIPPPTPIKSDTNL